MNFCANRLQTIEQERRDRELAMRLAQVDLLFLELNIVYTY